MAVGVRKEPRDRRETGGSVAVGSTERTERQMGDWRFCGGREHGRNRETDGKLLVLWR